MTSHLSKMTITGLPHASNRSAIVFQFCVKPFHPIQYSREYQHCIFCCHQCTLACTIFSRPCDVSIWKPWEPIVSITLSFKHFWTSSMLIFSISVIFKQNFQTTDVFVFLLEWHASPFYITLRSIVQLFSLSMHEFWVESVCKLSLTHNRKFDPISQSGWITLTSA